MSSELIGFLGICAVMSLWLTLLRKATGPSDAELALAVVRRRMVQVEAMAKFGAISERERRLMLRNVQNGANLDPIKLDDEGVPMSSWEAEQ